MRLHVCSSKRCRFADFFNGVIFFVILCSAFLITYSRKYCCISGTFCRRKRWEVRELGGDDGKSSNYLMDGSDIGYMRVKRGGSSTLLPGL